MFKTCNGGFSIELRGNYLELRGIHDGLPLYESLGGVVEAIAIVEDPAIEINCKIINEEERIIAGPIMIPDYKIIRDVGLNGKLEMCYWYFSVDTIRQLMENFKGEVKFGH